MIFALALLACQPQTSPAPAAGSGSAPPAGDSGAGAEDTGPSGDGRLSSSPLGTLNAAPEPATIAVTLTDAPGAFEAVPVTIGGVSVVTEDDGEIVLVDEPTEWDLLALQDGVTGLLGTVTLEAVEVEQIRLLVTEAAVVVGGVEIPLQIPSGQQTGIKIPCDLSVEAGLGYELRLDFDAHESIRVLGHGGYQLSPVVTVAYFGEAE